MKVYLAGPMRGYPDNNMVAFDAMAALLRADGHEVWSPAEADRAQMMTEGAAMREYMLRDLPALLAQDALVLLDDWQHSHGACLERHVADVVGMPVYVRTDSGVLYQLASHDWRWRAKTSAR